MSEKPIIFSTEMVKAILDGRKTQTRRVIKGLCKTSGKVQYTFHENKNVSWELGYDYGDGTGIYLRDINCPYGQPSDRLWVRETWGIDKSYDRLPGSKIPEIGYGSVWYAIEGEKPESVGRTRSSRFMPRWASRITLEIVNVRVQHVQEITRIDCVAEGISSNIPLNNYGTGSIEKDGYAQLWDSINAKRGYGWDVNPWVWVIEFRIVSQLKEKGKQNDRKNE